MRRVNQQARRVDRGRLVFGAKTSGRKARRREAAAHGWCFPPNPLAVLQLLLKGIRTMRGETKKQRNGDVPDSRLLTVDIAVCATAHRHAIQRDAICAESVRLSERARHLPFYSPNKKRKSPCKLKF